MKKIFKWFSIVVGIILTLIVILGLIFSQLTLRLIMGVGSMDIYYGNNERGNEIIKYAMTKADSLSDGDYHAISVQNTKNGNYDIAINALEKGMDINPRELGGYYGWILLYYYRDYERALKVLNEYDAFTPNFSDAPSGEDIHYLKGLAYM